MNSYVGFNPNSGMTLCRWLVRLLTMALVILGLTVVCTTALAQAANDHGRPIKVMTRNVYQGTDFTEPMKATDMPSFLGAVTSTIQSVRATKPATRIAAVAQEIADNTPDVVALQEATLWEIGAPGAYTTEIDPVALLLADLDKLGEPYVSVIVQPQFVFEAPCTLGYWVRTTTQIAILVRADSLVNLIQVTDAKGGLFYYQLPLTLPDPLGSIYVNRGWAYADITYGGKPLRFVTAHPEAFYNPVENAQVYELITTIGNPYVAGRPVIMAADFNTNALAAEHTEFRIGYEMITGLADFTDAWAATERKPALTCCQTNELTNAKSLLDQEIDFVFTAGILPGDLVPTNVKLTGNKLDNRVDGLWPSDHAGLITRIRVGQ